MGSPDEITKGRKDKGSGQVDLDPDASARRAQFALTVQPAMTALHSYLRNLVEHLNRGKTDAVVDFEVNNCKGLRGLRQRDYRVSVDSEQLIQDCTLRYACVGDTEVEFFMPTKEAAERQQQYLWKHKLKIATRKTADERWAFKLEANVPVIFEFGVDDTRRAIRLRVTNHARLGVDSYTYNPDDINAVYLDELAKYIMRKPSRFHALSGNVLPEDTLQRLRSRLAESKAERDNELDGVRASELLKNPKGVLKKGLFRGLFKK